MAIPINKESAKKVVKYGLPVATLGVSTTNMSINASRHRRDTEYQDKQLQAMTKLTNSLNKVDRNLKNPIFGIRRRPICRISKVVWHTVA